MAALVTLIVGLALGLFYGHRLGVVAERSGTTAAQRLADVEVRCRACGRLVKASTARAGCCRDEACLTSVERGRARMDEARAATGDLTCDLTVTGWEQRGWHAGGALIEFRANDRRVRFVMEMPDRNERRFTHTVARGQRREQWRALALVIKAKLAAVNAKIVTFEEEFLAHVVLPNGHTVWEETQQPIAAAYASGLMPELLPKALGPG
jgi:hypothetical protein